jgi:N-acetyl-anhydromuramyl-L-alanine amidase AmpD
VVEHDGWKTRGRPGAFDPRGVMLHHTGSNADGGTTAGLSTVQHGRPDLPGPLAQCLLSRNGIWHVIAAGRCNHAGKGKWRGDPNGNGHFIGVEAENNGVGEVWPDGQLDSLSRGTLAFLAHMKADDSMACGHKEYALPVGRKIDPSFDMLAFRDHLERLVVTGGALAPAVPTVNPTHAMLRKGDEGPSVKQLQQLLNKNGAKLDADSDFGPATETAVKAFQKAHGLLQDGKVGPKTWAALGVK